MRNQVRKAAGAGTALGRLLRYGPAVAAGAAAAQGLRGLGTPRPRSAGAPEAAFSAQRAMRHVCRVAARPHPVGSPAADDVRAYLLAELKELGFETEVQEAVSRADLGPTPYGPRYRAAARVRNVIGRLPGTVGGAAVLLMTHYDSVPQGPGASDAGVPVAALLEALRAFLPAPEPLNDLLVVFTDGEEAGTLGGRAFFDEHPLAATVRVVLNFEARGTDGPVLMFESGHGNGPLVDALARTGVPVVASSLFDAVYRRMDNATDFSHAKERGLPGLNFAHVGGFARYHGPHDDVRHVDPAALQQHGELALGLLRELASADLARLGGSDAVFFPAGRGRLARVPAGAVWPATAAALLLWAGGTRRAGRRGAFTPGSWGRATAAGLLRLAAGAAGTTALVAGMGARAPEFRRHGDFHDPAGVYAAVAGLAGAVVLAAGAETGTAVERTAGATAPLVLASAALAATLPGGSYVAVVPLLGGAAGLWLLDTGTDRPRPVRHAVGAAAAAAPAAALLVPLSRLLFHGLTPRMAGTSAVVLQLCGELAAPAIAALPRPARRALAAGGLATAAGVAAHRLARRPPDAPEPPATLSYLLAPDDGRALWISSDRAVSGATRPALGDRPERGRLEAYFPGWQRDFLHAPAPVLDLPAPELTVLGEEPGDAGRRLVRLRLRSPRGARVISLAAPDDQVRRWRVADGAFTEPDDTAGEGGWELWLHAVPAAGEEVVLELPTTPVRLRLLDREDGLPPELDPPALSPAAALDVDIWGNAALTARTVTVPTSGPAPEPGTASDEGGD